MRFGRRRAARPVIAHLPSPGGAFTAVARALSETSYTLYLTHFPFLTLIVLAGIAPMEWPPSIAAAGIYLALISAAILWAAAIWWCFRAQYRQAIFLNHQQGYF